MKKTTKSFSVLFSFAAVFSIFLAAFTTGCSSVFSAGITGKIVDADSATVPKEGVENVEVFAYTDKQEYEADYSGWNGKDRFSPTNTSNFFGHATTSSDGSFSISKVTWKNYFPKYGKTADYCVVYFLFYHEDYGLIKNDNVATVLSDATSNTVYQEISKSRANTIITVNIKNAANDTNISDTMNAKILVPQNDGTSRQFKETITGSSTVRISYPRYTSSGAEYKPTISITVEQSGNEIKWKQCKYVTTFGSEDYSFSASPITMEVYGKTASVNVYVKARKLSVPNVGGKYMSSKDDNDDGKTAELLLSGDGGSTFTIAAGQTSTYSEAIGPQSTVKEHGLFKGLGTNYSWYDDTYTEKASTVKAQVKISEPDGTQKAVKNVTISSNTSGDIYVQIP